MLSEPENCKSDRYRHSLGGGEGGGLLAKPLVWLWLRFRLRLWCWFGGTATSYAARLAKAATGSVFDAIRQGGEGGREGGWQLGAVAALAGAWRLNGLAWELTGSAPATSKHPRN